MKTLSDFKKENGDTDWKAYKEYEINTGERCFECDAFIGRGQGFRRMCYSCIHKEDKDEWDDDTRIRCPKCKNTEDVFDGDSYDLLSEDTHSVTCNECGYKFDITTSISYIFKSPELLGEEKK